MPNYDYICSACGHRMEVVHRIHEAGPQVCPRCGAEVPMRKGIVTTAVHFKGSGWAKKDRSAGTSTGKAHPKDGDVAATSKPPTDGVVAPTPSGETAPASPSAATATANGGD